MAGELTTAMQIAERVYSLAQEQNDAALMISACNGLACTLLFLGDFESGRQYAIRGVQIWRSGNVQSYVEDFHTPVVGCLIYGAVCEWLLGEIACCHAMMDEGISKARELKDMNALAVALNWAANVAYNERNRPEVDRLASDLIELSTRHNFVHFLTLGAINRGWARSASGDIAEGIPRIEQGIRDLRATGAVQSLPIYLARKAEALHLADRTSEALEAINEAETLAEKFEQRYFCAELHRLRGVFLAAMGAEEIQIEASFGEAIKIAKEQKAVSLEQRVEATYAEYCRQKASRSGGSGFRIPL
jgi:adenylate cyclase